jgi:hypothetical protein
MIHKRCCRRTLLLRRSMIEKYSSKSIDDKRLISTKFNRIYWSECWLFDALQLTSIEVYLYFTIYEMNSFGVELDPYLSRPHAVGWISRDGTLRGSSSRTFVLGPLAHFVARSLGAWAWPLDRWVRLIWDLAETIEQALLDLREAVQWLGVAYPYSGRGRNNYSIFFVDAIDDKHRFIFFDQYEIVWCNDHFVRKRHFIYESIQIINKGIIIIKIVNYASLKKRIMINWHHSLIRWHHSSNTLTFASHIRKESFVKQKSLHLLHARCTRNALEVLQHKSFVDLLSWSSAFELYKYDSKRAIFDVDYQVWNESFLKSWDFDVLRRANTKKSSKLSVRR